MINNLIEALEQEVEYWANIVVINPDRIKDERPLCTCCSSNRDYIGIGHCVKESQKVGADCSPFLLIRALAHASTHNIEIPPKECPTCESYIEKLHALYIEELERVKKSESETEINGLSTWKAEICEQNAQEFIKEYKKHFPETSRFMTDKAIEGRLQDSGIQNSQCKLSAEEMAEIAAKMKKEQYRQAEEYHTKEYYQAWRDETAKVAATAATEAQIIPDKNVWSPCGFRKYLVKHDGIGFQWEFNVSQRMLNDTGIDIEAYLRKKFRDKYIAHLEGMRRTRTIKLKKDQIGVLKESVTYPSPDEAEDIEKEQELIENFEQRFYPKMRVFWEEVGERVHKYTQDTIEDSVRQQIEGSSDRDEEPTGFLSWVEGKIEQAGNKCMLEGEGCEPPPKDEIRYLESCATLDDEERGYIMSSPIRYIECKVTCDFGGDENEEERGNITTPKEGESE